MQEIQGDNIEVFQLILGHFEPFSTYFEENIPPKSTGACLFWQGHLFCEMWYIGILVLIVINMVWFH